MIQIPTRVLMLLVVTFVIFATGVTWAVVRSTSKEEYCTGSSSGSEAELQEALDEVMGIYPNWARSDEDGSWRREGQDPRAFNQDVYRVEEDRYIALRANSEDDGAKESEWLVVDTWCSAADFLDSAPPPPEDAQRPAEPAGRR